MPEAMERIPSQATYSAPPMASRWKAPGKAAIRAPSPSAAAANQVSVPAFMPATPTRAAALPLCMPVAMANRLAGPGVMAMTNIATRKAA